MKCTSACSAAYIQPWLFGWCYFESWVPVHNAIILFFQVLSSEEESEWKLVKGSRPKPVIIGLWKGFKKENCIVGHPDYYVLPHEGLRSAKRAFHKETSLMWEPVELKRDDGTVVLKEIMEDIFNAPDDHSVAHCVPATLDIPKGLGLQFRKLYGAFGSYDKMLKLGKYSTRAL